MKKLMINIIAIIRVTVAVILLLAFSACSKLKLPECKKWEVKEEGTLKCLFDLSCDPGRTRQLQLCGDALKDASTGNTVVTRDDDCCRVTRTFIRVVP